MVNIIVIAVFIAFQVIWHCLKTANIRLDCIKKDREIQKLELEIEELESKQRKIAAIDEGRDRLEQRIAALPEDSGIRNLLPETDHGCRAVPSSAALARKARNLGRGSKADYHTDLVELLSADALLMALSDDIGLVKVGVTQLRNLYEAGYSKALDYLHLVEYASQESPDTVLTWVRQEIEEATETRRIEKSE